MSSSLLREIVFLHGALALGDAVLKAGLALVF
jgi:hypothetical protein